MELRGEYADIANRVYREWVNSDIGGANACTRVALACQALADRPMKELTDAEKYHLWLSVYDGVFGSTRCTNGSEVIDKIIAAFLKAQREPRVVKFRAARHRDSGQIYFYSPHDALTPSLEWLDADGKPQEFEVKV